MDALKAFFGALAFFYLLKQYSINIFTIKFTLFILVNMCLSPLSGWPKLIIYISRRQLKLGIMPNWYLVVTNFVSGS
jgi:hypothetical protein